MEVLTLVALDEDPLTDICNTSGIVAHIYRKDPR